MGHDEGLGLPISDEFRDLIESWVVRLAGGAVAIPSPRDSCIGMAALLLALCNRQNIRELACCSGTWLPALATRFRDL